MSHVIVIAGPYGALSLLRREGRFLRKSRDAKPDPLPMHCPDPLPITQAGSAPRRRTPAPRATSPVKRPVSLEPFVPLPLVAEPLPIYTGNIPQVVLAAMEPGRDYTRSDVLTTTGIKESDWLWTIRQLKDEGKVVQVGETRGARYRKPA